MNKRINPNGYFNFFYLFWNRKISPGFFIVLTNSIEEAKKRLNFQYPGVKFLYMNKVRDMRELKLTKCCCYSWIKNTRPGDQYRLFNEVQEVF